MRWTKSSTRDDNVSVCQKVSSQIKVEQGYYEKLYNMLMAAIPSSVLMIDRRLCVISVNHNFLNKARRELSSTLGYPLDQVIPRIILEEMQLVKRIQQVFEQNESVCGERMAYRAPRVPLRIYYYSIIPVTWNENVEYAMLLMNDVTEQIQLSEEIRQIERHLASVVESASDIVLSTDPKGALVTWNRAAEEITGYKFRDVEGKLLFSFCSPQHHELVQRIFRKIENLGGTQYAEWSLQTNTSQEVLASWVCSPMQNEAGRVIGVVAVGRDLTERRKLEMQILQSQKLAALGVMAGGIAHEIRNPLAISSSAAQFLIEEPICELEPEFVVKCAEKIHQGIHRASKIIENLMRFARPSFQNELESVDLVTLCNDTIGLVANEAKLKKVELDIQLPSTPMIINGQPHMLQQMLMNLMLNAFRAMPNGGRIKFSLQSNHEEVMLYIADTGTGIPTHNLDKIFDPFFTTSPVGEGVGLGLSLCYSIIKQHFGAIEVESTPNKGSLFTIRLPLS